MNKHEKQEPQTEESEYNGRTEEQGGEPSRYAVSFETGAFVPCPRCGAEIVCPDQGFDTQAEALTWALEHCECCGASAWRNAGRPAMNQDSPCTTGYMKDGKCALFGRDGYRCTEEACSNYKPELYAPEAYATAIELWKERRRAGKEWEEFGPVAAMLAWAVRLPEPAPYWEVPKPPRIEMGCCLYCGQSRALAQPEGSQEAADRKATELCKCPEGQTARRRINERGVIAELFAGLRPEALELLYQVADLVREDYIKPGTSVKVAGNCVAKFKVKDGCVIITRSEKLEHQHSL